MFGIFKVIVAFLSATNLTLNTTFAQESAIINIIQKAIEKNEADVLSSYLNDFIKFEYDGQENVVSKRQFIAILSDFINKYEPSELSIKEMNEGLQFQYYIVNYCCKNKQQFKLLFLSIRTSESLKIYQLKIEKIQ